MGQCETIGWKTFGDGVTSISGTAEVNAMAAWDDGGGEALYIGGRFTHVDGVAANNIARWDGKKWTAVGSGTNDVVYSLAVWDSGDGEALYLGGSFWQAGAAMASRIAKWDGTSYSALGSPLNGTLGPVYAMAGFDDGDGSKLFVGGFFMEAGGEDRLNIAKWNGTEWESVGLGANGDVLALTVHDDGNGAALYAGGKFTTIDGTSANRVAKMIGGQWTALGQGVSDAVYALESFDDGSGAALFAGGKFLMADGASNPRLASWRDATWSAVGGLASGEVRALHVGGAPPTQLLLVGGTFGLVTVNDVSTALYGIGGWDGMRWRTFSTGVTQNSGVVRALQDYDAEGASALAVGGTFMSAGQNPAIRLAAWSPFPFSADCNVNRVRDDCEIANGLAGDCDANGSPDECDAQFAYQIDDDLPGGLAELNQPGDTIWFNRFIVQPGGSVITHLAMQSSYRVRDGFPVTLLLYDDPNNDGLPSDAVLLASASVQNFSDGGITARPHSRIAIPPTYVGSPGDSFFVGAFARCDAQSLELFWVAHYTPTTGRSRYTAAPLGTLDPALLNQYTTYPFSTFTLRALALDCNGNGVWDDCDIDGGFSQDVNGDGIPDECQPGCGADIAPKGGGNGMIDIDDLLVVINFWGATGAPGSVPGDITRNGVVDIDDLLEIVNSWGPCV